MGTAAGFVKLVKAGFVLMDASGAIQKIIAFQYNPETLVRRLNAGGASWAGTGPGSASVSKAIGATPVAPLAATQVPAETVSFTLALDAADKLEHADPVTLQNGLLPMISALELLLYPGPGSLTVWVSGNKRILPVRVADLVVSEQAFDPALNPIRADVTVSLQVLKDEDFPPNSRGRALWDAHYAQLQQLARALEAGTLGALGLAGI